MGSLGISSDSEDEQAIAGIQAQGTIAAASASAQGTIQAAITQAGAQTAVASINAETNLKIEKQEVELRKLMQQNELRQAKELFDKTQVLTKYGMDLNSTTSLTTTKKDNKSRKAIAKIGSKTQLKTAKLDATVRNHATETDATTRIKVSKTERKSSKYSADQQVAVAQVREEGEKDRLKTKLNYADEKFQLAYGLAQRGLGEIDSQSALGTAGLLGLDTAPAVSVRPVFTPAQIRQQVAIQIATNDARTASQVRDLQGDLAGRGFSSNSPLLDALRVGLAGQALRANVQANVAVRLQAAQANADQTTKSQTLALSRWQEQQQVALDAEKNQITRQVGILGAVAQMVNIG